MRWQLLVLSLVAAGCNCGYGLTNGAPCQLDSDCASRVCTANRCVGNGGSGGNSGTGGNGSGGSNGNGGGNGMSLPDGGRCENLQCQVITCPAGMNTTLAGTVYDPGGNVPLYNVTVYVPNRPLDTLRAGPSCGPCGASVSGAPIAIALTGPDGKFTLPGVPNGQNIPLVMQIGKWRRQVTVPDIGPCQTTTLTDPNLTRLPRDHTEGDLPQFAISSGDADHFECLLRKIGISDSEFTPPAGGGRVHFFVQNGLDMAGAPAGNALWTQASTLSTYDVVILPCEGAANGKPGAAVNNMRSYANTGGRIFATHFSYVWTQPGWPTAAGWQPGLADLYNTTFNVTVDQTFPKGQAFAQWLSNVNASQTLGTLGILESRHDVTSVGNGSTRWLYGDVPAANPMASIQHLTYNTPFLDAGFGPDGGALPQCGRVVFSDFHVTAGATDGGPTFPAACAGGALSAQEKALEFMLFDLSACVQDDSVAPMVCKAQGQGCMADSECCAGLGCRNAQMQPCAGGAGCTCQFIIQ